MSCLSSVNENKNSTDKYFAQNLQQIDIKTDKSTPNINSTLQYDITLPSSLRGASGTQHTSRLCQQVAYIAPERCRDWKHPLSVVCWAFCCESVFPDVERDATLTPRHWPTSEHRAIVNINHYYLCWYTFLKGFQN